MRLVDVVQAVDQEKIQRGVEQSMGKQKYQVGEESLSTVIRETEGEQQPVTDTDIEQETAQKTDPCIGKAKKA